MGSRTQILRLRAPFAALLIALAPACGVSGSGPGFVFEESEDTPDPPEVVAGERLFLETRFAEFYFASVGAEVNRELRRGDPTVAVTVTRGAPLPGPFAGRAMNCRVCHLVDEHGGNPAGGVRTYADFARRSPIPAREDGAATTPRNSPPLVNASLPRDVPFFLHFDGEFATAEDLVVDTLTGRNYGWLPEERAAAIAHIARVVRLDDGRGELAEEFGGLRYADLLRGAGGAEFALPKALQLEADLATDEEVVRAVARIVVAYMESLVFIQDARGEFDGGPYDRFLASNGLPRAPEAGETDRDYSLRLRDAVEALEDPVFVTPADGALRLHPQLFAFGDVELEGLKRFLAEPESLPASSDEVLSGGVGSCMTCHPAPNFTDFGFHNVGTAQAEYDAVHGAGAFAALEIPSLGERRTRPDLYLPPSAAEPRALGLLRSAADPADPRRTDLGLWNVFANDAIPAPQEALFDLLCAESGLPPASCTEAALLPLAAARFKTPGLRDLGQSAPYFHTGREDELEDVLRHYRRLSQLAREGAVPNAAPELAGVALVEADLAPLVAFLRSLNEDYE